MQQAGNPITKFDVNFMAIGKKGYGPGGCCIKLDKISQEMELCYTGSAGADGITTRSKVKKSPLMIAFGSDCVQEIKKYVNAADTEGSPNQGTQIMSFLAIRADLKGFDKSIKKSFYDHDADKTSGKRFIVVEMLSSDLKGLLDTLSNLSNWGGFLHSDSVCAEQAKSYAVSLLKLKAVAYRQNKEVPPEERAWLRGKDDDQIVLVYPFAGNKSKIEAAAENLEELSALVCKDSPEASSGSDEDGGASDTDAQNEFVQEQGANEQAPTKKKRGGRAHYVTVRVGDFKRLDAMTYLNDTLIDFFIQL